MNITIIAPGTQGDVRPYVALGRGLKSAGHGVRLATHQNFASLVAGNDLDFHPLHGDMEAMMRDQAVGEALAAAILVQADL
ncbi:MAG: glycosyltransferase [Anaerolineales bacterium]|nr:glycosyltransferase [Anaerolineales bacterium]